MIRKKILIFSILMLNVLIVNKLAFSENIAVGKAVTASSIEHGGTAADFVNDGNEGTRWSSLSSDDQWIYVDLGSEYTIESVVLKWETAYGLAYSIEVSDNASDWTKIYDENSSDGGYDTIPLSAAGRFVRMSGITRATGWGYSLWEMEVHGSKEQPPADENIALDKRAFSSSSENGATVADLAFDGDKGTRWASDFSDPQWIYVDLGASTPISRIVLEWETAYGSAYKIEISDNAAEWTEIYSESSGDGGKDDIPVSAVCRYVRLYGTERATGWGYSLWEMEVYGKDTIDQPLVRNIEDAANIHVFDNTMADSEIQAVVDSAFTEMEYNQFGTERHTFFFKPGYYNVNVNVGFYTSVIGLGQDPDDVTIEGAVRCEADWFGGNGTQNFWRSAENAAVIPTHQSNNLSGENTNTWAASQAAPFRRMHIKGNLELWDPYYDNYDGAWTSGGFVVDSVIDGEVRSGSQQQYLTRNTQLGWWSSSLWNQFFLGDTGGVPAQTWPEPAVTVINETPIIAEKPYIYFENGEYFVFVPALQTNTAGPSWINGSTPGQSIPIGDFYITDPAEDTAATINNALAYGKHLLLTPGIYRTTEAIKVNNPDTIVLGIGYPTIIPENGNMGMQVADVGGVKIAGILFDAGLANSPVLLEVGPEGSSRDHSANPTSVYDIFCRVGGAGPGNADVNVIINSNDVIGDHFWLWRGDHGTGVGWDVNKTVNGIIVNGDDVTIYGLFVEHFHEYQTVWNGERGRTYFYQSEMPYEPPYQSAWMNGSLNGYASYKVADHVNTHEAWGLGVYCVFTQDLTIKGDRGIEAPDKPGINLFHLVVVSLGGQGEITHVINDIGVPADVNNFVSKVNEF